MGFHDDLRECQGLLDAALHRMFATGAVTQRDRSDLRRAQALHDICVARLALMQEDLWDLMRRQYDYDSNHAACAP